MDRKNVTVKPRIFLTCAKGHRAVTRAHTGRCIFCKARIVDVRPVTGPDTPRGV